MQQKFIRSILQAVFLGEVLYSPEFNTPAFCTALDSANLNLDYQTMGQPLQVLIEFKVMHKLRDEVSTENVDVSLLKCTMLL